MKRVFKIVVLMATIFMCVPVFAAEHNVGDLVPVGEGATVKTDLFSYTEISYVANVSGKDYGRFNFQSVTNVSSSSSNISIDILLFDAKKENIGFVTYCTDQDYGGEYAQKKLNAGESTSFYINVVSKYFVENKGPSDVMYFSVYDDNKYCHVGGYTKYQGLTIEEIMGGVVVSHDDSGTSISFDADIMNKLGMAFIGIGFAVIIISIISLIVHGVVLNALHKKMFNEGTMTAYLPIGNQYIAAKLAFGEDVAKIYVIAYVIAIPLLFVKYISVIAYLICLFGMVAFIIDIIKLVTKDYAYKSILQKRKDSIDINAINDMNDIVDETIVVDESELEKRDIPLDGEDIVVEEEVVEEPDEEETILNLDYSSGSLDATVSNMSDQSEDDSHEDGPSESDHTNTTPVDKSVADGESDLMNLFK